MSRPVRRAAPARPPVTVADLARHLGVPLPAPISLPARPGIPAADSGLLCAVPAEDPAAAGRSLPAGGAVVRDISDDSRAVAAGHAYLAVPGRRHHGLDFQHEAAAAGAVVVISDRPSTVLPTLLVDDPRAVGGPLSAWFHGCPSQELRVFGVTGTNGKTSTSHFLEAGLAAAGETSGLISGVAIRGAGTDLQSVRTTPEAPMLQRTLGRFVRGGVTACAMEVSSHAIDQRRVDGVRFRAMAFTNLGHDHLDYHRTMDGYYRTKASLFTTDRTDIAVVSVDDAHGRRLASEAGATTWTCSVRDPAAHVHATDVVCDRWGSRFTAHTPMGAVPVHLQVLGPHQVSNALVALTCLVADGVDLVAAAAGISGLRRVPGRCEPVRAGQQFTAIVDYMHNEPGQRELLPFLRSIAAGRLILVMGATGGRDRTKRRPLGRTAASFADLVIVTDESPEDEDPAALRAEVLAGAFEAGGADVVEEPDRDRAFALAVAAAEPDDLVVVVGRGSDTTRRFGARTERFDDHDRLRQAIVAALDAG